MNQAAKKPVRWLAALLAGIGASALAQSLPFKVVGPDGSVTYTDRPPVAANARVTRINRDGSLQTSADQAFDSALRSAVQRFPVTLYVAPECLPCDNGRQLLLQRGVPFTEKRVVTEDDVLTLERSVGARTVPTLTIGAQALVGLAVADWNAYLDAAGYPRESRLPKGWQPPAATAAADKPTPRTPAAAPTSPKPDNSPAAAPAPPSPPSRPTPPSPPEPLEPAMTGIRF